VLVPGVDRPDELQRGDHREFVALAVFVGDADVVELDLRGHARARAASCCGDSNDGDRSSSGLSSGRQSAARIPATWVPWRFMGGR
jgi:hypothetical protein